MCQSKGFLWTIYFSYLYFLYVILLIQCTHFSFCCFLKLEKWSTENTKIAIILKRAVARSTACLTWRPQVWMVVNNLRLSGSLAGSVHNNRGSCGGSNQINRSRDYSKKPSLGGTLLTGKWRENRRQPLSLGYLERVRSPFICIHPLFVATAVVGFAAGVF